MRRTINLCAALVLLIAAQPAWSQQRYVIERDIPGRR